MNSTPEALCADIKALLAKTDSTSIFSGGCEIPKNTDPRLLKVMCQALFEGSVR